MQPNELRQAGETVAALAADPSLRDWRMALAQGLDVPLAEIESYARGERPISAEFGQRVARLLQELGRRMSEPGRLLGETQRRNEAGASNRGDEERQHGPLTPAEAESGVWPGGPPSPRRAK